jgi:uncharacterized protein YjbI with pentapeptide repeats
LSQKEFELNADINKVATGSTPNPNTTKNEIPHKKPVDTSSSTTAISQAINDGSLSESINKISNSAESFANVYSTKAPHQKWYGRVWQSLKSLGVVASIVFGSAFALEQYRAGQYFAEKGRIENKLISASSNVGNQDHVVRANALRTIVTVSEFSTYSLSNDAKDIFQHLTSAIWGSETEYPYFQQSWAIFNDVAKSQRKSTHHLVSTVLLGEGAKWEKRIRNSLDIPRQSNNGSILFNSFLDYAIATDQDLASINFGYATLISSDLSNSDCTKCIFLKSTANDSLFKGTKLNKSYLSESEFKNVNFSFSWLRDVVATDAIFSKSIFTQADLTNADFSQSIMKETVFHQSIMENVNFTGTDLSKSKFIQVSLESVIFDLANLEGADFRSARGINQDLFKTSINVDKAIFPEKWGEK